jgi:CTP:molybdopterin cytidylyltransferase MocA
MNGHTLPAPSIAILAAGFSTRLGIAKALARVHGRSLLRRTLQAVDRLTPGAVMVIVPRSFGRLQVEARGYKVIFLPNERRAAGLSSSVRRAIELARYSPALLLLPVDLAAIRRRDLARLISRWRAHPRRVAARRLGRGGATSSAALHSAVRHAGVPLILPHGLYRRALPSGDTGLRDWVSALPAHQIILLDLPSASADVDTPQELQAARRSFRRGSFNP